MEQSNMIDSNIKESNIDTDDILDLPTNTRFLLEKDNSYHISGFLTYYTCVTYKQSIPYKVVIYRIRLPIIDYCYDYTGEVYECRGEKCRKLTCTDCFADFDDQKFVTKLGLVIYPVLELSHLSLNRHKVEECECRVVRLIDPIDELKKTISGLKLQLELQLKHNSGGEIPAIRRLIEKNEDRLRKKLQSQSLYRRILSYIRGY